MPIAQVGGQLALNHVCGNAVPVVSSSAPAWFPGLFWIDSGNSYVVKSWNGSAWVVTSGTRYLALLTGDPTGAVNVSDLTEVETAGYARVQVGFNLAASGYPSIATNNGLVSWGPFTDDMEIAAQWAAMVTSPSGTSGELVWTWALPESQKVTASELIQVATGQLQLDMS